MPVLLLVSSLSGLAAQGSIRATKDSSGGGRGGWQGGTWGHLGAGGRAGGSRSGTGRVPSWHLAGQVWFSMLGAPCQFGPPTDIYMHDMQSCIGTMNRVLCASAQMRIMASASFGPFESFELLGCWRDQELVSDANGNGLTLSDRFPRNIEPDGAESLTLCTYIVVMPGSARMLTQVIPWITSAKLYEVERLSKCRLPPPS